MGQIARVALLVAVVACSSKSRVRTEAAGLDAGGGASGASQVEAGAGGRSGAGGAATDLACTEPNTEGAPECVALCEPLGWTIALCNGGGRCVCGDEVAECYPPDPDQPPAGFLACPDGMACGATVGTCAPPQYQGGCLSVTSTCQPGEVCDGVRCLPACDLLDPHCADCASVCPACTGGLERWGGCGAGAGGAGGAT